MVGLLTGGATLKFKIDVIKERKNKRNVISICYNTADRTLQNERQSISPEVYWVRLNCR